MPKGKYYGPDKYKGVRPDPQIDPYYGPNKHKGIIPAKKKKKKKSSNPLGGSLMTQAKKLGKSKYAPVLAEIEGNRKSNIDLYNNATGQRQSAVNREVGSISAAGATTRKRISDASTSAQEAYLNSVEGNRRSTDELMSKVAQNNDAMLSTLQAEMKARGMKPEDYMRLSPVTQEAGSNNETLAALGKIRESGIQSQAEMDKGRTQRFTTMADMQENTGKSQARGAAQANFDELYTKFLDKKGELDTAAQKAKLEKQDYINNTYLTLKEKKEAEKAAAAQAKLQAQIASGNLDYKYTKMKVDTQYKYDKLASDRAQKDIENRLKSAGFDHKKALDLAKLALSQSDGKLKLDKWNWEKLNPKKSVSVNLEDLINAGN